MYIYNMCSGEYLNIQKKLLVFYINDGNLNNVNYSITLKRRQKKVMYN
jgi:hypothetical protein